MAHLSKKKPHLVILGLVSHSTAVSLAAYLIKRAARAWPSHANVKEVAALPSPSRPVFFGPGTHLGVMQHWHETQRNPTDLAELGMS